MNILIPHSWLLEHLETKATPQEIQKFLSLSGPSVERIHEIEGEPVYDIEVTTNRVDSMSVRGIAREAAVILTNAGIVSKLKPLTTSPIWSRSASPDVLSRQAGEEKLEFPIIHNDPKLCKRISCVIIADVKNKQSPEIIQKRLRQIGVNTHDLVIDMTNYVTHELGHPCHAFDYDSIMKMGGEIIVTQAQKGEKFAIIDGTEFECVGGEVVFKNPSGTIIDLPAIKGNKNTSINDNTKNVLFWIESIQPKKVRFASMTHAIRTTAAQLSEKGVDPELAEPTLRMGAQMLTELGNGKIVSEFYDEYPGKTDPKPVHVTHTSIENYLGISIPPRKVEAILIALGCEVTYAKDTFTVIPPSWRSSDIEIAQDVIEEVARIYGYHNLPSILMQGEIPTQRQEGVDFDAESKAKHFLSALGLTEVYTYSLISLEQSQREGDDHVKLKNPLTDDLVYLRTTLWVSHATVLSQNPEPKDLGIFEVANTYTPDAPLPQEKLHLTVSYRGDQRQAKGIFESLCKQFYIQNVRYLPEGIELDGKLAGSLILQENLTFIDLDWAIFLTAIKKYPVVATKEKFTPMTEDLTFTLPKKIYVQRVMEAISAVSPLISSVKLSSMYEYNFTFGLSYASDKDVSDIRKQIVEKIENEFGAKLVGKLE
ncbi:MAG TPA: phenylalanine--tRNA ligase subunit beta [Patescibacteria group bacterium]|nr:phenylalanine--tRNA ligase subunit beta [Patescibacteria group bacterium]